MSYSLFLIEGDLRLVRLLIDILERHGYSVQTASDEKLGRQILLTHKFDLIILDVPGANALEICTGLRLRNIKTPIVVVGASAELDDRIAALKSGADDYLASPFDTDELLVRIGSLLRRFGGGSRLEADAYEFGGMQVNFSASVLIRNGSTIQLSQRESRLLRYFVENRGNIISRDTLLQAVWGYRWGPLTRTVDVHIVRLRQKIEDDPKSPRFIVTVYGLGYRFDG